MGKKKMDWKLLIIIILICVIIGLTAVFIIYSKNNNKVENTIERKAKTENIVTNKDEEKSDTDNTINKISNNDTNKVDTTTNKTINYNEPIDVEGKYSLTVKSFKIEKIINPPNTNGYYRYYEASEGHKYLEIVYDYKNLATNDIRADKTSSIKIKYDNKYEYSGFNIIEDDKKDFTYSNITSIAPLSTGTLHYLIEIPDEVADGSGTITATITCGSNKYDINLR